MYKTFKCLKCKTTVTVPTEDLNRMESEGRELRCVFGHKEIIKVDPYEGMRDCMQQHDTYKKQNGVTKQTRWSR